MRSSTQDRTAEALVGIADSPPSTVDVADIDTVPGFERSKSGHPLYAPIFCNRATGPHGND
jgi:hypothetical protein